MAGALILDQINLNFVAVRSGPDNLTTSMDYAFNHYAFHAGLCATVF